MRQPYPVFYFSAARFGMLARARAVGGLPAIIEQELGAAEKQNRNLVVTLAINRPPLRGLNQARNRGTPCRHLNCEERFLSPAFSISSRAIVAFQKPGSNHNSVGWKGEPSHV